MPAPAVRMWGLAPATIRSRARSDNRYGSIVPIGIKQSIPFLQSKRQETNGPAHWPLRFVGNLACQRKSGTEECTVERLGFDFQTRPVMLENRRDERQAQPHSSRVAL